jgi:hypothetical protein
MVGITRKRVKKVVFLVALFLAANCAFGQRQISPFPWWIALRTSCSAAQIPREAFFPSVGPVTTDDLFDCHSSPRMESLVAAAVQWAGERSQRSAERTCRVEDQFERFRQQFQ